MHQQWRNLKTEPRASAFEKIERLHPYKTMLYLAVFGSSLVFLFMMVAYLANSVDTTSQASVSLPKYFTVSTILLLVSSFTISRARQYYLSDETKPLLYSLLITFLLGLFFAFCQFLGWNQLESAGIYLTSHVSGSYIYVISGLHLIHLFGCLVFLGLMLSITWIASRDPVKNLLMVTDPMQQLKVQILTAYWHFLDLSWLAVFLFFLFVL